MSEAILDQPPPAADARIAYGPEPLQFGDLRLPAGPGPHPTLIMIHGGFWRAQYDLEHLGHLCAALTARGVATWSIEYRRIGDPGGGWPGMFHDVAAAVDWLRTLAPQYNLDLARTAVAGHSAGGHLALWAAARARLPADSPLWTPDPLPLRAACALAGVSDLTAAWELRLSKRVVAELLGGGPADYPERFAAASPAALLPLGLPQVLVHGTKDGPVPFSLSENYVKQAQALGDSAQLVALPGAHHFELIDPSAREWPEVAAALLGCVNA